MNITRYFYSLLFYLILPFIFIRLGWKALRQPAYGKRLRERLGFGVPQLEKCIWIHAVSMGETIAAIPLIKSLQTQYAGFPFVVTTMTPTGAEKVKAAFGDSVIHVYLPYDLPGAMNRLLSRLRPVICILMETELWPNLLAACHDKKIPVCLVNARLSEKSAAGYQRFSGLTRGMLRSLHKIAAHGKKDAERFIALGAMQERMVVTGNIKFDIQLPADLTHKITALKNDLGERFIWIAASTHEGEEDIIFAAHKKIREQNPHALLILVPRHPHRFDSIAKLSEQFFSTARRSLHQRVTKEISVYLGDTMGELLTLYGAADAAFVAGSLIPRGGHNMLEPAALAKPLITGMHLFNFAEISDLFVSANALIKVRDAEDLAEKIIKFMQHPEEVKQAGERALQVVADNRGALAKQVHMLKDVINYSIVSA